MRDATKEESLAAIEAVFRIRLRKAGKTMTEDEIKAKALQIYADTPPSDRIKILEF
jgi:hypothetical protein